MTVTDMVPGVRGRVAAVFLVVAVGCATGGGGDRSPDERIDAALARGDTSRAIHVLERVIRSSPASADDYARIGALYRTRTSIKDRLKSQRVLQNGLQHFPDDPDILLELGKTYYAQTFFPDAQRCFNAVLELDPGNCEAHYYVALNWFRKWKHIQVYSDYLVSARRHFERVVECAPGNRDAHLKLAFSAYALGDTASASRFAAMVRERFSDAPEPFFLRGAMAYEQERYALADTLFRTALSRVPEDERELYRDISILLSGDDLEVYELAAPEKREEMRRAFWGDLDPDPTTPVNQRLLEHVYRMYLADAYYRHRHPSLRGWDTQRGKALVKFGQPAKVLTTLQGDFLSGRMEVWAYQRGGGAFTLVFRDAFLNGNYTVPMEPRYTYAALTLALDPPASTLVERFARVPGDIAVFSFRKEEIAEIYVALRINVDSLARHVNLRGLEALRARAAFYDAGWTPHAFLSDTLRCGSLRRRLARGDSWYYVVRSYEMPFDRMHVAFTVEDPFAATKAILRAETNTIPYLTDSLTLSDIVLQRRPKREKPPPDGFFRRGERIVYPNPGGRYEAGEKLRLYVEVYNLGVSRAASTYDITYSIYDPVRPRGSRLSRFARKLKSLAGFPSRREPAILQTLRGKSRGHEAAEELVIDIAALRPGPYVLEVSVRDSLTGQVAARTTRFTKSAGPAPRR